MTRASSSHPCRLLRSLGLILGISVLLGPLFASPAIAVSPDGAPPTASTVSPPVSGESAPFEGEATSPEGEAATNRGGEDSAAPQDPASDGDTHAPEPMESAEQSAVPEGLPAPEPSQPSSADAPENAAAMPGQSDQPAPESKKKLVLDNGHIDAFTPVLTNGRGPTLNNGGEPLPELNPDGIVQLMMKEDVTEMNRLRTPDAVLLHIKPNAKDTFPAGYLPGLSGDAYHLPYTQDHDLIWPGWETQLITAEFPEANTNITVSEIDGPGEVFVWAQNTFGQPESLLLPAGEKRYQLPATISQPYPAHTHAAWAFTEPGTYTLAVQANITGSNGNIASTQTVDYTFVVGDLADHRAETVTDLAAKSESSGPDAPVTLTAKVTNNKQRSVSGAVQFRDLERDEVLGHAHLDRSGIATFRTTKLRSGDRVTAEFVPSWSDDFTRSRSQVISVEVVEVKPKPELPDTVPATETELQALEAGKTVRVLNTNKTVVLGNDVSAEVDGSARAGEWVSVWLHDAKRIEKPEWYGWWRLDGLGNLVFPLSTNARVGDHRLVVKNAQGDLVGWDAFTVKNDRGGEAPPIPVPPKPVPPAPVAPSECLPSLTLDHGHVDAFTVSAGGGRAALQLMEDVTGLWVPHAPESVLLQVKESAHGPVPSVTGTSSGYLLPLQQQRDLVWPGWRTYGTAASGYYDVSINVTSVSGPGRVSLYTQGSFGGFKPVLTHGGYALPGTIHEKNVQGVHTHAFWTFSQKGVYTMSVHAVATNPDSGHSLRTASHTYVFRVGDVPLGDVFCGLSAHGADDAAYVNAAVGEAEAQLVAAAQAGAEKNKSKNDRRSNRADRSIGSDEVFGLGGLDIPPAVAAGLIGGGALVLAGIAGGTVFLLRRIRYEAGEAGVVPLSADSGGRGDAS